LNTDGLIEPVTTRERLQIIILILVMSLIMQEIQLSLLRRRHSASARLNTTVYI